MISHPEYDVHAAKFSADDRWVVFRLVMGPGKEPAYIAPVRDGHAAPENEWIQIADLTGRLYGRPMAILFTG